MTTPHWSWHRILDSVGAVKNDPSWAEAMDEQRITLKRKTRQTSLINENSVLGHKIKQGLPFLAIGLLKSGRFHGWNLVDFTHEIQQISPVKSRVIAPLLHTSNWIVLVETSDFIRLWVDFTWNPLDFMKSARFHLKSARFHECELLHGDQV